MSSYVGYIVKVKDLREHTNADRLQIATFFRNDVIVGLDTKVGDIGVFFPTDLQLGERFCIENDLLRRKTEDGKQAGGYLEPGKRNIKAVKLRGEKSEGLYLPISCFDYLGDVQFAVGDTVDIINGEEICTKYIPKTNPKKAYSGGGTKAVKKNIAPLFKEHADTEQLVYNLNAFKEGDFVEITLKCHGTSQRTGYLPILKGYKKTLFEKIFRKEGTPIYDWGYVTGTRRTILKDFDGGFYGSDLFRAEHAKRLEGKLLKGETCYYEVCGYVNEQTPIMGSVSNSKIKDKEFKQKYGDETVFSYGCEPGESKMLVYRMTMTNEDGDVIEYTPDFMRYRCEQMGVETVPVFWSGFVSNGEEVVQKAEEFFDGPDPIGKTHVREGVVIRILNRPKFTAYKHKNFSFKCLSGIISDSISENSNMSEDMLSEL